MYGKVDLKSQGVGYVLVFSLHNSILLWTFNTTTLVNDALHVVKLAHLKLKSIITLENLNSYSKFWLNQVIKILFEERFRGRGRAVNAEEKEGISIGEEKRKRERFFDRRRKEGEGGYGEA